MTDHDRSDELRLPFIFVPYGEPESPEVAAFKARYPDWFSIPASFVPYPENDKREDAGAVSGESRAEMRSEGSSSAPRIDRMGSFDTAAALRAFQRASAEHGGASAAMRALRDAPEMSGDDEPSVPTARHGA